jgi:PleD family two-component response regulator
MNERVLVVDDDRAVRNAIVETLSDAGFDCVEASDGAYALEVAHRDSPDAVVLDILMPRLSGDDVHDALRRDPLTRYTPVIFVSAQREPREKVRRLRDGADYLTKPFDTDELTARVSAAIQRSKQLRSLNPLSGLPGNVAITTELTRRLADDPGWACVYCDIDQFKEFNDHYGFARGDEVIVSLARILVAAGDAVSTEPFVGHVGGDDFVMIIPDEVAERAAKDIIRRFDANAPSFYDGADRERGYIRRPDRRGIPRKFAFVSVSLGIVPIMRSRFADAVAVSRAAAEVKEIAKRRTGSGFAVDRRRAPERIGNIPLA